MRHAAELLERQETERAAAAAGRSTAVSYENWKRMKDNEKTQT